MNSDFITKCRGCLAEEPEMHNIFHLVTDDLTLANILTRTTSIQIDENENNSPYLCLKCTRIVVDFYNFKVEFAKSQTYFQNELLNSCKEGSPIQFVPNNSTVIPEHIILVDENVDIKDINKELERLKSDTTLEDCNQNAPNTNLPSLAPLCIHTIVGKQVKEKQISDIFITDTNKQVKLEVGEFTVQNELVQLIESVVFCCNKCSKEFLLKDEFLQHINSMHGKTNVDARKFTKKTLVKLPLGKITEEDFNFEDTIVNRKVEKRLCKICNILVSQAKYVSHYDKHKTFICTCGAKFLRKSHLVNHKMSMHSEKRPFVCTHCNKAFKVKETLSTHLRYHTHPRSEICHICGQRFNDKSVMNTHIKLKHFPTRDFQCNFCGLNFPMKSTLFKHIRRRHTERERTFSCSMCNMAYYEKFNLNRHISTKHSGQAVGAKCEFCGKIFSTKGNLYKHLRIKHKHDHVINSSDISVSSKVLNC